MAIIEVVPTNQNLKPRTFSIEEGDLVMLTFRKASNSEVPKNATIGFFSNWQQRTLMGHTGKEVGKQGVIELERPLYLMAPTAYNGVIFPQAVPEKQERKEYVIRGAKSEVYVGKENIVDKLRDWKDLSIYADYVQRMDNFY